MNRNPHTPISKEPITREQVLELRRSLEKFWEDTSLVTKPNQHYIIDVGNLEAVLDTLLDCKDFDNPQLMMGRVSR